MKFFATTVALAAAAAAEADPQFITAPVVSSPLLKTILPATTYTKPVAVAYNQVPFQTQYVHTAAVPTQYVATKPVEVETTVEKVEEQKVAPVAYAHQPIAYQPAVYAHQQVHYTAPTVAYAAQPAVAYAQPAVTTYAHAPVAYAQPQVAYVKPQTVYKAKNGAVEHTVISKREAEAEPIDYVQYQTGALSSVKVPTLQKTLRAYGKYPVHAAYTAPVAYNGYAAHAPVAYTGYAATPAVYAGQYAATYPQVYANQYTF